jgi:hypothetical protein
LQQNGRLSLVCRGAWIFSCCLFVFLSLCGDDDEERTVAVAMKKKVFVVVS